MYYPKGRPASRYERAVIDVRVGPKNAIIDLDTYRDGAFEIPPDAWCRIKAVIKVSGVKGYNHGTTCMRISMKRDLVVEAVKKIAEIINPLRYCCEYAETAIIEGKRMALVRYVDSWGMLIEPESIG